MGSVAARLGMCSGGQALQVPLCQCQSQSRRNGDRWASVPCSHFPRRKGRCQKLWVAVLRPASRRDTLSLSWSGQEGDVSCPWVALVLLALETSACSCPSSRALALAASGQGLHSSTSVPWARQGERWAAGLRRSGIAPGLLDLGWGQRGRDPQGEHCCCH